MERREKYGKERGDKAFRRYFDKWRKIFLPLDMVEEILRLWDLGVIKLEEKVFPD
jgi:hypothetical protein